MKKIAIKVVSVALLLSFMAGTKVIANPVDTNTAKIVAKNFLQKHDPTVKSTNIFRISHVARANGLSNLYIVERTDKAGFVVISADDCVQPVLAYSSSSAAVSEIPVNAMDWFRGYDGEIAYCVANNVQATEEVNAQWTQLYYRDESFIEIPASYYEESVLDAPLQTQNTNNPVVGPLLTTTWNQAPLYNNLCPYDNNRGDRTVVGCVASAMAQIMKYWNYPANGVGTHSYQAYSYRDNNLLGTLSVDFANTTYDWANMPTALTQSSSQTQINAVATLMYHCGVAVEMRYGVSTQGGSYAYTDGTYRPSAELAFKTYFGYKTTVTVAYRSNYTDASWDAFLRSELDARRPLLNSGSGTGGGHAFVCDGYDNNGLFHYNWGWGGSYDGFFASNNLAPAGGGIGSNQSNTFTNGQDVVCHIEPDNSSLIVRPESLTMPSTGGGQTFVVRPAVADTGRWHAYTNYPWIMLSSSSGVGSGTAVNVMVTSLPNTTGYNRSGLITFVQHNDTVIVPVFQGYGQNSASGQYGNTMYNYIKGCDSTATIVFRPEMYGNFNPGDTVKSVFFTTLYHPQAPQYVDSVFTIRIYENPTITNVLRNGQWDSESNVLGTPVYTQTYYQRTQGDQVASLTTPYIVNSNTFWVSVRSEGRSLLRFYSYYIQDSVRRRTNYPVVDSLDGFYLEGRQGRYRLAYSYELATDTNYVYQFNSHYTFGINVSVYNPVVVSARPDNSAHGSVTGGGPYSVGDTVTLRANTLPGYTFSRWSDSVSANPRTFVIQPNTSYPDFVAMYSTNVVTYNLSVVAGNQYGTTYGSGTYFAGDTAVAIAIPADSTKAFSRWNDNNVSNPRRVVMNANTQLVAYFTTRNIVATHDTIHDTTYVNLGVYDTIRDTAYVNVYVHDTILDTIYINVAVHDTIHDTAFVNLPHHNFNIVSDNSAQGVTVGTGTYPQGLRIGIAAVPNEGYRFSHWSDNNTDNPRHFTVSEPVQLTAYFVASSGITTPDKNLSFEIYPNPTMGFITLSQYAEKVEILDNVGRLVNTVEGAINLDLSGLADGTYTLRITSQGNVVIKKVVKR